MTPPFDPANQACEADEQKLGENLELHLSSRESGKPAPEPEPQFRELVRVVDRLHELEQFVTTTSAQHVPPETTDLPDMGTTTDECRIGTGLPTIREPAAIGKYQIRRSLGQGGQGSAYLAFDPDLKRHVVLKLYRCGGAEQEGVLREGQALARVRSPYVAQVHGIERHEGAPYLVVEYIPGHDLAEQQRRQPADHPAVLELMSRLAEGLAAVHACGLLHRDIKPANILIGDDGLPRLVDFGLAAPLASDQLRGLSGTLAYMAPEQARGESERIDPRTDIFGLGAVFYELLTGRPPYRAPDMSALLELARAGDITPPRQIREVPKELEAICLRCLARAPAQRFASALELKAAVDNARQQSVDSPGDPPPASRSKLVAVAGLVAVVALLAFVTWRARHPDARVSERIAPEQVATGERPRPPAELPRHPDGQLLHHDFPVAFEVVGGVAGAHGVQHLTEGDVVRFRVKPDADCYVGIWYTDEEGAVVQLFPNRFAKDHFVRRGTERTIPTDDRYAIRVTPSKKREYLHVFASTKEWKPPVARTRAGPFEAYDVFATPEDRENLAGFLRGLVLEAGAPSQVKKAGAAKLSELVVPIEVAEKEK